MQVGVWVQESMLTVFKCHHASDEFWGVGLLHVLADNGREVSSSPGIDGYLEGLLEA